MPAGAAAKDLKGVALLALLARSKPPEWSRLPWPPHHTALPTSLDIEEKRISNRQLDTRVDLFLGGEAMFMVGGVAESDTHLINL